MATITTQAISEAGSTPTLAACAADGDQVLNTGTSFLLIKVEEGASTRTVSVTAQVTEIDSPVYGLATKANATVSCASNTVNLIGPFETSAYTDDDGYYQITYSDVPEGLTIAALEIG